MHKCKTCNKKFTDEKFNQEEEQCILHSKDVNKKSNFKVILHEYIQDNINKDNELNIFNVIFPNLFNYNILFLEYPKITFWDCTFNDRDRELIFDLTNSIRIHFHSSTFNDDWIHLDIHDICYSGCTFNKTLMFSAIWTDEPKNIKTVCLHECNIHGKFNLDFSADNCEPCKISMFDLTDSTFHKKVEIKDCILENANLINTRFKDLADFYKTQFKSYTYFIKTSFEDITVFTESVFEKEVNFKYTTFSKLVLFRKTKLHENINFIDSIFEEGSNFLEMTGSVKNRETARIIKNSFIQQNNIIESNRFYTLEMKKMEEDLDKKNAEDRKFFDWLIFKIHGITSEHSQSPSTTLFWIFTIGFIAGLVNFFSIKHDNTFVHFNSHQLLGLILFIPLLMWIWEIIKTKVSTIDILFIFLMYSSYTLITTDYFLSFWANTLNPFSIMTGNDKLTFLALIYKSIIAYLIYQLIISIRQNTRIK